MFNREFLPTLQDGIRQFINNMFNDGMVNVKLDNDRDITDEKDTNKINKLIEYLFNTDFDFAEYFISNFNVKPDMKLEMIIFCNEYLENNFGEDQILNWRRYNEPYYVVSMMAYVYIQQNRNLFIELLNHNKNEMLMLQVNCLK